MPQRMNDEYLHREGPAISSITTARNQKYKRGALRIARYAAYEIPHEIRPRTWRLSHLYILLIGRINQCARKSNINTAFSLELGG